MRPKPHIKLVHGRWDWAPSGGMRNTKHLTPCIDAAIWCNAQNRKESRCYG